MWSINFSKQAQKQIKYLDKSIQSRIKNTIIAKLSSNADIHLEPLVGDMSGLYKFRVGDHRLLCIKEDTKLIITVIKLAHRREVYKIK